MSEHPFGKWFGKVLAAFVLGVGLIALALLALGRGRVAPVWAATDITSDITSSMTWTVAGSPYNIQTNTVSIITGAVLRIEPGVRVQFAANARLEVGGGKLVAIGTAGSPITFTSISSTPNRGDWQGIIFGTNAVSSSIEYAVIEYAKEAVQIGNNGTYTFSIQSNTIRYVGDGGSTTTGGGIIGGPEGSMIAHNTIYSAEVGIKLVRGAGNEIFDNRIFGTDDFCVSLQPSLFANSERNTVAGNTLFNCGGRGIWLEGNALFNASNNVVSGNVISNTQAEGLVANRQRSLHIIGNTVASTTLLSGSAAVSLTNLDEIVLQPTIITGNQILFNGGSGAYRGGLYVANIASSGFDVSGNLIRDTLGSGFVFEGTNSFSGEVINGNAFCVEGGGFELENNDGALNAPGNWWSTNTPAAGSEYTGTVTVNPVIVLTGTIANPTLPADGSSTTAIVIRMQDGSGNTVPGAARTLSLAASAGSVTPFVTLNDSGVATATLTAAAFPTTATITITELCNYSINLQAAFQQTDLQIAKTTPVTTVTAGGLITYTLLYTNNGAITATNALITDTLPPSTTYAASTAPGWTTGPTGGGVITWHNPSLAPGASGRITLTLQVAGGAACGSTATTLLNRAAIGSDTSDSNAASNTFSSTVTVACPAGTLAITKTAGVSNITPDRDVVYTIAYANTAPFTVTNVTITDTLPLSVTFGGSGAAGSGFTEISGTGVITWGRASLGPNESGSFTMTVHVNPQPTCNPFGLTNTVRIAADFVAPGSDTAAAAVNVLCGVDLVTVKNDDVGFGASDVVTSVVANSIYTYTINVVNMGSDPATNVVLSETIPASTTFVGPVGANGWFAAGGRVYTYAVGTLNPGQGTAVRLRLRADMALPAGITTVTNNVCASSTEPDVIPADNCDSVDTDLLGGIFPLGDLAITKTVSANFAVPGRDIVYTIEYANQSAVTITNVLITDTLPVSTTYIGDSSGFTPTVSTGTVVWHVGSLPPAGGGTAGLNRGIFTLTLRVDSTIDCNLITLTLTNTAAIAGDLVDTALSNNTSAAQSLPVVCGVDLVTVKNDDVGFGASDVVTSVVAGTIYTYTISVVNMGSDPATNVVLSETIPANTTFVGPVGANGWFAAGGRVYTYAVGTLAPGGGTVVYLQLRADYNLPLGITTVTNEVCASSAEPDLVPADNCDSVDTDLLGVALQLALSKSDGGLVCALPGQLIDYTIRVTNTGTTPAGNLRLTDFLPNFTSFQGPAGMWTDTGGGAYTHTIASIAAGARANVPFWVQVEPTTPATVTQITNRVQVDPPGLIFSLDTPIVHNAADLWVVKNDNIELLKPAQRAAIARIERQMGGAVPALERLKRSPARENALFVNPGDTISYTMGIGNAGTVTATVVVTEFLPANSTFLGPLYWTAVNSTTYVYNTTLGPGKSEFLDFRVQVDDPFPDGVPGITNTVRIAGAGVLECDLSNNVSVEFTPVGHAPFSTYLPIIIKNPTVQPTPTPTPPSPTPTPVPLAYVSDVAVDADTNQVFVASPRHNWVYVINGFSNAIDRVVPVGNGPTGLTVLTSSVTSPVSGTFQFVNNKVFVAHQYGANFWRPGVKAFGVFEIFSHDTFDGGYAGAAPIKIASNPDNWGRVYVSNYYDKLAVLNGYTAPPETRLGWVEQKAYQGAYGIDVSRLTNRVYLATRDTGELVVFDGNGDRLLQPGYIPTHIKPPQACSLWSVAVNETTGHVFVPCPQLGAVFVLDESQVTLFRRLEAVGRLVERDGYWARVVEAADAPWIYSYAIPVSVGLGEEGIAVDTATNRVYITNAATGQLVLLQDGDMGSLQMPVQVIPGFSYPQGVDVNPRTGRIYVANAGNNTLSVLSGPPTFSVIAVIPLTP